MPQHVPSESGDLLAEGLSSTAGIERVVGNALRVLNADEGPTLAPVERIHPLHLGTGQTPSTTVVG